MVEWHAGLFNNLHLTNVFRVLFQIARRPERSETRTGQTQ